MISAFIPTLNNERTIRRVIQALKKQTVQPRTIIIIDSGSTDNTEKIAKEEGIEFYSPSYFGLNFLGLGRARNRILELIDTKYLLSVDSDIIIEPDHIEKVLPLFDIDEKIAGIAGKQIELNRIHIGDRARAVVEMRDLSVPLDEQKACYKDFILGSNNIYDVEKLREVGLIENKNPCRPFEDSLVSNYEDVDIGNKLHKQGYKLYFDPSIKTYHMQKDTLHSFVHRAYRYRVFKWEIKGAFKDHEIYQRRIDHNVNYTNMGIEIAYEKARYYLIYPFVFAGFNFFLEDILKFIEVGNVEYASKIYNSFQKVLPLFASENIKQAILKDNAYLLKEIDLIEGIEVDEVIFSRFKELATLDVLHEKFPAIHDKKLDAVDKGIQVKAVESSYERILQENELNIYGKFRVLLLNSPWQKEGRFGVKSGSRWPHSQVLDKNKAPLVSYIPYPFFLAYTYELLQKSDISSWILDAVAEGYSEDEYFYEVMGYEPNLIILETSTPSFYHDLEQIKKIKKTLPNVKICLVGSHIAFEKEKALEHHDIDFAINSEYEVAVLELSTALKNSASYKNIDGLIYRDTMGIQSNGKTKTVDFKSLRNSYFNMLPFYNYNDRPIPELSYPSFQIQLSRGCPYKCTFCLWPQVMYNKNYQLRDLDDAIFELKRAKQDFGIQSFYIDDDTFNINKAHLMRFANLLIENEIDLPWAAMARADTIVDEETLTLLKRTGLIMLKFGIESVEDDVIEVMQKDLDIKKCEETITLCKRLDIKVHLTFSVGYFNDSKEGIQRSFDWLIKQNPDSQQISIVTPFPGTVMYEEAKEKGFTLENDFSKYDGAAFSVVTSNLETHYLEKIKANWIEQWLNFKNNKPISRVV